MSVEYRNIIVQHLIKITGIGSNIGKIKMLALWKIEDMFGEEFLEDPFQKVQTDIILLEGYSEPIGYINFSESEMRWLRNVSDAGTLIGLF